MQSICNQSYKNLQIIVVNDGSSDNSGKLCDDWACKDTRIKVIHKENGGLSDARNAAFSSCSGQYITFVDSDDIVSDSLIEHLYDVLIENGCQLSMCDPAHYYSGTPEFKDKTTITIFEKDDAISEMLYQTSFLMSAWGKLYKLELFDGIRFPVGMLFEDVAVMYILFDKCSKIAYSNAKLYGYFHRENSITTTEFSIRDCDILKICEEISEFSENKNINIQKAANTYVVNCCFRVWLNAPKDVQFSAILRQCESTIKKNALPVLSDIKSRNKLKVAIVMFVLFRPLLRFVYAKVDRWR